MVKGMTCSHCKSNVEKTILNIDGVEHVNVNSANGNVIVYGKIDRETIVKSVKDIGFDIIPQEQIK